MSRTTTIAVRCAALSNAAVQNILDAEKFARRVRSSRHDMIAINAELLAIKTSLDIIHDDFSSSERGLPPTLLKALSGTLDCCGDTIGESHKSLMKLAHGGGQAYASRAISDVANTRQHLRNLHATIDLALDHVSIFTNPTSPTSSSAASTLEEQPSSSRNAQPLFDLLKRIDLEREHVKNQTHPRAFLMERRLNELRECAKTMYEECIAEEEEPKRSDSMDPEEEASISRNEGHMSMLTLSSVSTSNGIGTWLANVASHIVQRQTERPELVTISRPNKHLEARPRHEGTSSPMTFYAESTTSGSLSGPTSKHPRSHLKELKPQFVTKSSPTRKNYLSMSTIMGSDASVLRLLDQYTNTDKVAIARSKRQELSPDEKVALDWDLRHASTNASPSDVERSLWHGADPNIEDPDFGFFFIRAAHQLSTDILSVLVEYGAEITKTYPGTYPSALHAAVAGVKLDTVQYLIEIEVPIDAMNSNGETPLHLAVRTPGAYMIAKFLLEAGADISGVSLQDMLAVSKIESRERSMMIELLLAHGAEGDINEGCARRGKGLSVLGLI